MEDPSVEWEIVNYPPCSEEEDGEAEKTRLGWVLSAGLSLGRKLVITGVVVTSVPLVLPSLIVVSALGFAFSVPFGVVFASYACTQKVMNKLLPSPATPIQTVETVLEDEEEEEEVDLEEKEEREAVKDGVEMRIELVDDDDARVRDEVGDEQESEFRNHGVGYLEGVDEDEIEEHSVVIEPNEDDENSVFVNGVGIDSAMETDDSALVGSELGETAQDDARFNLPISQVGTDDFVESEGKNNVENRGDGEKVLEEKDERVERIVTRVKGKAKDKKRRPGSDGKSGAKEMKTAKEENIDGIRVPQKRKEPNGDEEHDKLSGKKMELLEETGISTENDLNMGQVDVKARKERIEVIGQESNRDDPGNVSSERKQTGEDERVMPGNEDLDVKQGLPESDRGATLIDDAGNVDGSIEKEQKPMSLKEMQDGQSVEDGAVAVADASDKMGEGTNTTPENNNQSRMVADDGGYSPEVVAAVTGTSALKHDEAASMELAEGKDAGEELSRDEDIWKKIDAIRAIVGFKAPRRLSYVEELKALYLFTGIEPPSPSTASSDTAEFSNKLNFLMSVIVKRIKRLRGGAAAELGKGEGEGDRKRWRWGLRGRGGRKWGATGRVGKAGADLGERWEGGGDGKGGGGGGGVKEGGGGGAGGDGVEGGGGKAELGAAGWKGEVGAAMVVGKAARGLLGR
ncbi:hypothetical protein Salat_0776000 [Sesamum alatum]|uniref:Uncharacterized protein n=1 Tax=Sesamum alatum TaxID=300844 RepID=A0AAE1YUU1_9LAMI|nr:hypothetical protein Salat_0776000 [Sesamum alatum]